MKRIEILLQSLRMVFGNPGLTQRVSLVPMLVQIGATYLAAGVAFGDPAGGPFGRGAMAGDGSGAILRLAALGLVYVVTSTRIAVAWQRYLRLEERPGAVPRFMLDYFGYGILIAIILILPAFLLSFVSGALFASLFSQNSLVAFVVAAVSVYLPPSIIAYRFGMMLPGVASGAEVTLSTAGTQRAARRPRWRSCPFFLTWSLCLNIGSKRWSRCRS